MHIFSYWTQIFIDFVFQVSNEYFGNHRFSYIMYWIHLYISLSCNHDIIDLLRNSLPYSTYILFGLHPCNSSKKFWEGLVIVISFLSFKWTIHGNLLQISIAHNKNWNPLLNFHITCVSARSLPQMLSSKDEYILFFEFSNNWFVYFFC